MKKHINKFQKLTTTILLLLLVIGCETMELDHLNDPSQLSPKSVDPALLLNNIQLQFMKGLAYNEDNEDGINVRASEFMRMQHLFGAYAGPFALTSGSIDDIWENFYRETLQDIKTLIPLAQERGLIGYVGVAKLLKAYSYVTLVDTFGNVPFSEALMGNENSNPKADDGNEVYNAVLKIIDEAISELETPDLVMPNDLFYGGDEKKWITLGRTLKFKMYVQMRLIGNYQSEINTLISQGIIDDSSQDFEFKYSTTSIATGDSRHPYYSLCYDADGADDYLNSYFVNLLKGEKGFKDPRLRYYFYRQVKEVPSGDNLKCDGKDGYNYCYLGDYYWTRDHGDDEGVPPDQTKRSTYGLYPIGGAFDGDNFTSVTANKGAGGAGIFPIILSSYVKFLKAESALMTGTSGNPKSLLEAAIRNSMKKVLEFNSGKVASKFAATNKDVDNYVDHVLESYDNATDKNEKLNIIIKEYYIALWGNGIEAWNNYRRTSFPKDLSTHVGTSGLFPRSFMYPANVVNTNSNISQKAISEKVFWDTNSDNLK